jgi:hypothetical protein
MVRATLSPGERAMILSRAELKVLDVLRSCDGPMPVDWLKPH